MASLRVLLILLILTMSWSQSLPASEDTSDETKEEHHTLTRNKRAVGVLTILGLALSVASAIQGGICTFTNSDLCGSDPLPDMLDNLQGRLNDIERGLLSLQLDVADIWQETKQSWYLDQIEYTSYLRREVLKIPPQADKQNEFHKLKLQRFIDEVLGDNGNDKNVLEALYNIPRLVNKEGIITQYLNSQRVKHPNDNFEALKQTWKFIKNIFNLQIDGYVSALIAYGLKYKSGPNADPESEDSLAYKQALSEICALWRSQDPEFETACTGLEIKQPFLKDRRKPQQDYFFSFFELFKYPALQVEVDCRKDGTQGLAVDAMGDHANEFWGFKQQANQITKTDKKTKSAVNYPLGDNCGNSACVPKDVSVGGRSNGFRIAVATQDHLLLYQLGQSGGQLELVCKKVITSGIVHSAVVCGNFFGFMGDKRIDDYKSGTVISLFQIDCSNMQQPAKTWNLNQASKSRYLRCSNDGTKPLLESSALSGDGNDYGYFYGSAAIDVTKPGSDLSTTQNVQAQAAVVVKQNGGLPWQDGSKRLGDMAGLGFDSKGNYFISSGHFSTATTGNEVSGIYLRNSNGTFPIIREFPKDKNVKFYDLAVDEAGFVYSEQEFPGTNSKCVHKYNPELDLENVNLLWANNQ